MFFCVFILMNIAYLEIVKVFDWGFVKHINAENLKNQEYDCLILGNSLVMDALDTELLTKLGIPSFNLAIGGASIKSSKLQLESYLSHNNKKPRIVILGLGSFLENDQFSDIVHPVVGYTQQPYWKTITNIPLLKFSWMATELLKKILNSNHRNAEIVNGQLRISKIAKDISTYAKSEHDQLNFDKYINLKPLSEFAQICQINNIRLVVIEMPGFKKYQNNIEIGPYDLDGNGYSFQLYNFNNKGFCKVFDDKKDWLGNSHLNRFGAVKFTQRIFDSQVFK